MSQIVIRRAGNLIDVSSNDKKGLPREIAKVLEPQLEYIYVRTLYGIARIDRGKSIEFEPRRLYRYDSRGRMVCGRGFYSRIVNCLHSLGHDVQTVDKDPERQRQNCYQEWPVIVDSNIESFRPKQRECLDAISKSDCGIIDAPTGFGKSVIILMICLLYPKAKIHVVTTGKDLVNKTVRLLSIFLPNIGKVGCGKKQFERVTVISADSLHLSDGDADFLLVDEAHELMAPSYNEGLIKYRYSRNFAFTATPTGRADGADKKLESLFGPTIFKLTYQEAVKLGLVVQIDVHWLDVIGDNPAANYVDKLAKKRHGIWRNYSRNKKIADALQPFLDDQILILVDTIEHAIYLRQHLPSFELCYDKLSEQDRRYYVKLDLLNENELVMSSAHREEMRIQFEEQKLKHVIATGVWATGVSFDALPVLVWAGAGKSEIKSTQIPGRVCRVHDPSGKQAGILIDCCDQFDSVFENYANARCRNYKNHEWNQLYEDGRKTRKKRLSL